MTTPDPVRDGIPCMLMRGGTSKGAFFLAEDIPAEPAVRDDLMLRIMGSPDPTQIDGVGGGHPLRSKVAIVSRSDDPDADLEYLFLQISVEDAVVGTAQTCGNLLAAVGPFAVERGLLVPGPEMTTARIRLTNTGDIATTTFSTPGGRPDYDGDAAVDGVPGTACPIDVRMEPGAKPLLPTGNVTDALEGYEATLIDNGMPVVLLRASDFGLQGTEAPEDLESRTDLIAVLERVRRAAGARMGLGDVTSQTVPKMFLLAPPRGRGAISTRGFIPHRVHTSMGVLMAASIVAGLRIPGAVGSEMARLTAEETVLLEHPTGVFPARVRVERREDEWTATSMTERTARKLFDGRVYPRPRL